MSNAVITISSFNLLFFTQVLTVLTSSIKYEEYVTDKGKNVSIPCMAEGNVLWMREGDETPREHKHYSSPNSTRITQINKYLVLRNVSKSDQGVYVCLSATAVSNPKQTRRDHEEEEEKENDNGVQATTSKQSAESATDSHFHENSTITHTEQERAEYEEDNESELERGEDALEFQHTAATDEKPAVWQRIRLSVRTTPGPVSQLYFKPSTILGFLVWRFNRTAASGGYPVRSFTAEYRNVSYPEPPYNSSFEHEWIRMDPINIAPNVRQMEVYRLEPNTTYEFRLWANNQLGSGEMVTTNVTTLSETKEEDLIRLIQPDLDNFDPRIWIIAVGIVLGTLTLLAVGLCAVLSKECYQSSAQRAAKRHARHGLWDNIELVPNIILNPGFNESGDDDQPAGASQTRTVLFGRTGGFGVQDPGRSIGIYGCPRIIAHNAASHRHSLGEGDGQDSGDSSCSRRSSLSSSLSSDHEPKMQKFKRKLSVFFTDPTIKRI